MSGGSSAGRSRTSRVRGGRDSQGGRNPRGGCNSRGRGNYGSNVSRYVSQDFTDDEHTDQYDGLDNLNGTDAPKIGSPMSQAQPGSNAPSSQAQLGSNAPDSFLADPNKVWISITPDKSRFTKGNGQADNGEVTRSITTIMMKYYCGAWPTWSSVPIEEKKKMFSHFKLKYCWNPMIDEFVHDIFNSAISGRLSDRLSTDRDRAFELAEAAGNPATDDDISPILPYNPTWMMQEHWQSLVNDHWNTVKWLKISRVNKANRAEFVAGHHCTGSAGYVVFRERLEVKKGCPLSSLDFLIASHTKKGAIVEGQGSSPYECLIDDRSREAANRLSDSMIERYGEDVTNHPKHDQELWERAIGVRRKGRAYCTGTSSDPSFVLTGTPSSNSGSSYASGFEEVEKVKDTMEKMREEHEKTKSEMEEREAKIVEAHENAKKEMEAREERLLKEVEDSKAATEQVRKEMNEKLEKIMKHLPNFNA